MISVGNRDGRKGLELGFGSREDMKGSELEEGEAGFIDLNGDDENKFSTIDPDVALSYIDEKLQDVLGHFQKDFEGGVSAENLGAKFGGYGSFLPSYQRSPSWSHPRTPAEYNHYGSRSPDNGQLQNGQTNSLYSSPDIISSNSVTGLRRTSRNDQRNYRVHPPPNHGKELTSKSEVPNTTNLSDKKSWNADIYSGLGLDVSPSSSLNESPVESEGLQHNLPDIPDESLSRILQIMTSVTLSGRVLLSPLSDEVICLSEKEWITGESEPKTIDTANQESLRTVTDGSDLKVTDRKMIHGRTFTNSIEQSFVSVLPTYSNNNISHASSDVPKKETDFDTLSCQELISSTMKLPLLSDADGADLENNSVKSKIESKISAKGQVKSDTFLDVVEKKAPEPVASFENGRASKNTKKSNVSRKAKRSNEKLAYRKREINCTNEEDELAMKTGEHIGQDEITVHTPPETVIEKKIDFGEDILDLHPRETSFSIARENVENGDQNIVARDVMYPEDGILNNSLKSHQSKTSKSNSEDLLKYIATDGYKESFGGLELEKDNIESKEMSSKQTGKGSEVLETRSLGKSINISKEKSMGKKSEVISPSDRRVLASKGPNPDAAATAEAPLLSEDRVLCDNCKKWRILPPEINPTSLPEKCICTMLDWMPGMNHCDISQDETTLAVRAAPASTSASKHNQHPLSSINISVVSPEDARRSTNDQQSSGLIETTEVKENRADKDVAKGINIQNTPFVKNSMKRLHESTKTRSLNDIDNSPSINDFGQSSSLLEGRYCEENQNIPLQNYFDKDDILKPKIEKKNDYEVDGKRVSKKIKTEGHETDERIPKKVRVSKSEGKDRKRKADYYSGSANKVSRGTKDILGHDQRSTDAVEPLRKDLGLKQPSKVSILLKSKASLNEMKDSAIESVFSSPLRGSGVGQFSPRTSYHNEPIIDIDESGKLKSDVKNKREKSPLFSAQDLSNCNVISPDQGTQNARQMESLDEKKNERERNVSRHSGHSKKTGKEISSRSKDRKQVSRSDCDSGKANHFDPVDALLYEEKSKAGSNKSQGTFSDRTDKSFVSKKDYVVDCGDVSEREKSNTKQPSLRGQSESTANLQPIVELNKENGNCAKENDEQSKALKQPKTPEKPNTNQQASTRNSNSSIHKVRSVGESKDSSSLAVTNAVKEGKDLKHLADRLKNSGSTESTGLYFQAALKFLHGACLLESCSSENGKQPKIQSMEMYSSTAKLCEYCAHEYEKSRDMASAALAYKCVEVAYMRVIYSSHSGVNKVRNDVQTALQLIPTGDSPSSSASDIDNLNNAAIVDKTIASLKGVGSPQVAGTQVLTARNRSSCLHLIRFAQEVTFAMEASRKSRSRLVEAQNKEGISCVKRALDFNFQDVDGLLQLIRVAMEAINR